MSRKKQTVRKMKAERSTVPDPPRPAPKPAEDVRRLRHRSGEAKGKTAGKAEESARRVRVERKKPPEPVTKSRAGRQTRSGSASKNKGKNGIIKKGRAPIPDRPDGICRFCGRSGFPAVSCGWCGMPARKGKYVVHRVEPLPEARARGPEPEGPLRPEPEEAPARKMFVLSGRVRRA